MTEREIFTCALEKQSAAERDAFLHGACANDSALREHIEGLLRERENLDSLLERPPVGIAVAPSPTVAREQPEQPGAFIGRYKLLEQVGEGGMGVVYVAEQTEPVRRRVALKIIKPGMDTKQVIARFEAERQALAMMDHPNIARVLDAGTTDAGRPYFVMELVRGMPITEYCDKARLSPRQRLELFADVCQAVQHAHQKGVIHRDLKPSNVMITVHDGRPVSKVIDFGVAKAVGQQLTERTVYTALTQLVGTPLYMSPEQADLSSSDVDTRSDVYSLGVLLYELLTGQTPFDKERLKSANFDEMRRIIREDEPPRPSHRISTLNAQASSTISLHRGLDERHLTRVLRGELDWIVMKALEKDRSRRYESASALAADIQRYLSDEPVLACPPTAMYRFQKFARKHKPALATAASLALCLLLGTTVSAWQAVRATTAEAQSNANEQKAVANEQKAIANEQKATANAAVAEEKEKEAIKQRDEVKTVNEQLQRTVYASNMNLAKNAWDQHAVNRVLSLLDLHRPKPGEPDLRNFEWHYFDRLCHPTAPLTIKVKNSLINIKYSPDGNRLVSSTWGSGSGTNYQYPELKMWDTESGKDLFTLQGSDFDTVVFSPDGKRLISTTASAGDGKKQYFFTEAKIWDSQTGEELFVLRGHTGEVVTLAYSPDGKRIASGSKANQGQIGELKIWDAATGQELRSLSGNIESVAFSPDGKRLASATGATAIDGKTAPIALNVLDVESGQPLLNLPGGAKHVAYSPNGKLIAANVGRLVKVWNAETGEEIRGLSEKSGGEILFAFSPDSKRIATAGHRARVPRVKVCDTDSGEELFTFQQHTNAVNAVAFSPDSRCLATASADQTLRIWDMTTGHEIRTLKGEEVEVLAFSPDGKRLACGTRSNVVNIWDLQGQANPMTFQIEGTQGVMSADFKQFASASRRYQSAVADKSVTVWSADSGKNTKSLTGYANMVFSLAFSPGGDLLAVGEGNAAGVQPQNPVQVKIWDVKAGRELLTLKGHAAQGINSVAFSPDGKRLATRDRGAQKSDVKMWDVQTGQELFSVDLAPKGRSQLYGTNVVFSPDGQRFATGVAPEIKIFRSQDGTELLTIPDGGRTVAFSADGKRLAAGQEGFKIWDAETGQELLASRIKSRITALAFSPDGKRVASTSGEGTVTLWDTHSGHPTLTFEHSGERAYGGPAMTKYSHNVAFSADGHQLCSVLWDGTVRIWDATPLPEKP